MLSKRTFAFADVVADAAKLPVPKKGITLRPLAELKRVADPKLPLIDGPGYVTGAAQFGADVALPGMLTAMIVRPPVVGGKVAHVRRRKRTLAVAGVKKVVEMPVPKPSRGCSSRGVGIAVVAENTWAAMKGRSCARRDVGSRRERELQLARVPRRDASECSRHRHQHGPAPEWGQAHHGSSHGRGQAPPAPVFEQMNGSASGPVKPNGAPH